jgi:hypothetical protein
MGYDPCKEKNRSGGLIEWLVGSHMAVCDLLETNRPNKTPQALSVRIADRAATRFWLERIF